VSATPSTIPPGLHPLGERPSLRDYLRQVWERREFALSSAIGDLRAQHMDTTLGNVWHLLNPILMIAIYYLVFGVILDISRGLDNFIGFLTIGIMAYQWSQKSITQGSRTIIGNEGLIRSLQFPRALLPVAAILKETLAFLPGVVLMVAVMLITAEPVTPAWAIVVPAFALHVTFNLGVALVLARVADRFRDTVNLLPFVFRLGFYGSGVIFAVDTRFSDVFEHAWVVWVFIANPFYALLGLWREALMTTYTITTHDVKWLWISAIGWTVVALGVGLVVFRAGEKEYGRG
jgi:teichoic acid transport system permease protein